MKNLAAALPESSTLTRKSPHFTSEYWFNDDSCLLDMDYFIKTLSNIKSKGVRPDLIGSIIAHYASKWLPDLASTTTCDNYHHDSKKGNLVNISEQPPPEESVTSSWMKKRFFVETLIGILPPERDSIPCNFLLRLLRTANTIGVEPTYRIELEKRISWQLDQASLKELMIPSFSSLSTCATLLDVELVLRLVIRFVNLEHHEAAYNKSGGAAALVKVAKLVDSYLAEIAVDSNLKLEEFVGLATALPSHARATDDGLYRAIDTYLKAHPGVSKQERKSLCRLLDSHKLSPEASLHASQNERLPVRAVIQVMLCEQTKLINRHNIDSSGSFNETRSPNPWLEATPPTRCPSKRQVTAQQMEIKRLRDDVVRIQSQCNSIQGQIEKMLEKKRSRFFRWGKMFGLPKASIKSVVDEVGDGQGGRKGGGGEYIGSGQPTSIDMKTKLVKGTSWRIETRKEKPLQTTRQPYKLSPEASLHASQNERLPVRAVIQVMLCEQTKLINRHNIDSSGSFNETRSPNPWLEATPPTRCPSKRQVTAQQMEIKRLRDDVVRIQSQCNSIQGQIEKMLEKKRSRFFRWGKLFGLPKASIKSVVDEVGDGRGERKGGGVNILGQGNQHQLT